MDLTPVARVSDTRRAVRGAKHPMDIPGGNLQQSAGVQALPPEVRTGDIPLGAVPNLVQLSIESHRGHNTKYVMGYHVDFMVVL